MYVIYVLFNYYCFNNMFEHVERWHNDWIVLVNKKHKLTWWFSMDLELVWLWVQALENLN